MFNCSNNYFKKCFSDDLHGRLCEYLSLIDKRVLSLVSKKFFDLGKKCYHELRLKSFASKISLQIRLGEDHFLKRMEQLVKQLIDMTQNTESRSDLFSRLNKIPYSELNEGPVPKYILSRLCSEVYNNPEIPFTPSYFLPLFSYPSIRQAQVSLSAAIDSGHIKSARDLPYFHDPALLKDPNEETAEALSEFFKSPYVSNKDKATEIKSIAEQIQQMELDYSQDLVRSLLIKAASYSPKPSAEMQALIATQVQCIADRSIQKEVIKTLAQNPKAAPILEKLKAHFTNQFANYLQKLDASDSRENSCDPALQHLLNGLILCSNPSEPLDALVEPIRPPLPMREKVMHEVIAAFSEHFNALEKIDLLIALAQKEIKSTENQSLALTTLIGNSIPYCQDASMLRNLVIHAKTVIAKEDRNRLFSTRMLPAYFKKKPPSRAQVEEFIKIVDEIEDAKMPIQDPCTGESQEQSLRSQILSRAFLELGQHSDFVLENKGYLLEVIDAKIGDISLNSWVKGIVNKIAPPKIKKDSLQKRPPNTEEALAAQLKTEDKWPEESKAKVKFIERLTLYPQLIRENQNTLNDLMDEMEEEDRDKAQFLLVKTLAENKA